VLELGLYYSNQNHKSGYVFIGGEKACLDEMVNSDDTTVGSASADNISRVLTKFSIHQESAEI